MTQTWKSIQHQHDTTVTSRPRLRFAPSPTGLMHIGGYRTALFSWLYARHTGGSFILRIEDTDVARTVEGAVDYLIDGLHWLGMDFDEGPIVGGQLGPYYQTQRKALYQQYAHQLIASGHAYRCYCTPARLEQMRKEQLAQKLPPRYDRRCRYLAMKNEQRMMLLASHGWYDLLCRLMVRQLCMTNFMVISLSRIQILTIRSYLKQMACPLII